MSVCVWRGTVPTCGLGGYIFPEGGIKTSRRLSHPDGVPRGQNKRRLSLRWLHLLHGWLSWDQHLRVIMAVSCGKLDVIVLLGPI